MPAFGQLAALLLFPAASAISVVRGSGHAARFDDASAWRQPRVPVASSHDDEEPRFAHPASEAPSTVTVVGTEDVPPPSMLGASVDDDEWQQPWMDGTTPSIQSTILNSTLDGRSVRSTPNHLDPCFKFMHIPKTGGTSIDSTGMHLEKRAFGSLMANTYDRIAVSDGKSSDWEYAANLYDKTHQNLRDYVPFLLAHFAQYRWVSLGLLKVCQDLHTPPSKDLRVAEYFRDSCGTFCAVRNPLGRYLSGYKMHGIGPCTLPEFEAAATAHLKTIVADRYQTDCHFTPQVEFVYGARSRAESTFQYCQHIVHTESLNEEFEALMAKQGRPDVTMSATRFFDHTGCKISEDQVPPAVVKLVYSVYKEDYEALGYKTPAVLGE